MEWLDDKSKRRPKVVLTVTSSFGGQEVVVCLECVASVWAVVGRAGGWRLRGDPGPWDSLREVAGTRYGCVAKSG